MAEFLPHNSAINSRFQSQIWPIFENHAIKDPAHLGYSPHTEVVPRSPSHRGHRTEYSPHTEVVPVMTPVRPSTFGILRVRGGSSSLIFYLLV